MSFFESANNLEHYIMTSINYLTPFLLGNFNIQLLKFFTKLLTAYIKEFQLLTLEMAEFPSCSYILD
jgi:hypothetical protein